MREALEAALEALTNPSTIAVQHAVDLIREQLKKPDFINAWRTDSPDYEKGFIDGMSHQIKVEVDRRMNGDLLQKEDEGNRHKETQLRSFRLR